MTNVGGGVQDVSDVIKGTRSDSVKILSEFKPNYPVYLIVLACCFLGSFGNCIYHHETT